MGLEKYKYLVTIGCSQTYGQGCSSTETWSYKLAKELGLEEINLACNGAGWYYVQNTLNSFINSNQDKLSECFVILQQSTLERRVNVEEIAIAPSDYFNQYGMDFISKVGVSALGYKNWENYKNKYSEYDYNIALEVTDDEGRVNGQWTDIHNISTDLIYFPEHRHYPNSRHNWKLGEFHNITPPYIHDQFNELMLHWGSQMYSYHLYLKSLGIDHIMVDGYSPFLSYKLNFRNYYHDVDEYNFVKQFWSNNPMEHDESEIMLYDFKNINCGWVFDSIDEKYKIDDLIIWSLYQYRVEDRRWNLDGGHAGDLGMDFIKDVIKQNLEEKKWI